jgi:hypothetical protein
VSGDCGVCSWDLNHIATLQIGTDIKTNTTVEGYFRIFPSKDRIEYGDIQLCHLLQRGSGVVTKVVPARGKKEARRRKKELGRAGYVTFTQT